MRKPRLKRESVHCPKSQSEWQSQGLNPGLPGLNYFVAECVMGEFQIPSVETRSLLPTTALVLSYHVLSVLPGL